MKHTPTPWLPNQVETDDSGQRVFFYEIVNGAGQTIIDSLNSDVATIDEEHDEFGTRRWDSQGKVDIEFAALACNSHDALVEAIDQMVKAVVEPAMISMGFDHPPEYASEADHWLAKAIFDARNILSSIKGEK